MLDTTSALTYQNPVYSGYFADPFVFQANGAYYALGTGGSAEEGVAFTVLSSPDLVRWHKLGWALEAPSGLGTHFWAPEVAFHDGRYYLYYSVGFEDRHHQIRVAVGDGPAGPYRDVAALVNKHGFAIDASPFQDADGSWYLFYARDFLEQNGRDRVGTGLVVDRLETMTRVGGEERVVARPEADWQRFRSDRPIYGGVYDWHTLEGPSVLRHQGRYYCFYSGGCWQNDSYGIDYAEAPHPLGPWTSASDLAGGRVLRTVSGRVIGPGHNSFATGPDGRLYIVYHAWDEAMSGRRMCIDPLDWTAEGPRCEGPSLGRQRLEAS